jgi:hypothetical protein
MVNSTNNFDSSTQNADLLINRFPDVEYFRITVSECSDLIWGGREWVTVFSSEDLTEGQLNCHNSRCFGGGLSITNILKEMISSHKSTHEYSQKCSGYDSSPKGRIQRKSCVHLFKITAELGYKQA